MIINRLFLLSFLFGMLASYASAEKHEAAARPNIVFLFSDDHALNAISAYGGRLAAVAPTPNIDRLAEEGAIFENSFVANSICGPSRACILTGKHSHKNGFMTNVSGPFDGSQWTSAKALREAGYVTAVIGKWHLKSDPVGFDHWEVFPGQGSYYNPVLLQMDGSRKRVEGYATDVVTDKALSWLEGRDKSKPFFLMCQHKAPHRTFAPAIRHLDTFDGVDIPEPDNLFDDYSTRSSTLPNNEMEIDRHFHWAYDLKLRKDEHLGVELPGWDKHGTPEYNRMTPVQKRAWDAHFGPLNHAFLAEFKAGGMSHEDLVRWRYQRYMRNYLATVKSVDENVGRVLDYLDRNGLSENTIVIYSSDQGFYLGEHGWFDKRWMFEESFKMPFLIRWPGVIKPGSRPQEMIQNIDYAPTFVEIAGLEVPEDVQGRSLLPVLKGEADEWRESVYYAYYEEGEHSVPMHFGVRTDRHKLIYFPATDEWNLFDLERDPAEMENVYENQEYADVRKRVTAEYYRLRDYYDAPGYRDFEVLSKRKP
ncbi:sulfatase family protein [Pelagicoccus mobilis]|uniref:Sulfatase n=1 Tax=Pelagicoccus mobilis TaxID=415221 RepID=A0A934RYM1_9BACT|nr:sulfatase [Pelagicoccus mobilis]MBK1878996.1 sulfatase [Pelagicoccus mobilis]